MTKTDQQQKRGRLWRVVRWLPAAALAVAVFASWAVVFAGGIAGMLAWGVLVAFLLPLVGAITLLATGIYAICRLRFTIPIGLTVGLCLFALWPGLWSFGWLQIAYPSSLDSTEPAATVRLPSDQQLRVLWGGDRLATNYHAHYPAQRWAYDFLVEPYLTGSDELDDYGCWKTPVLAPANAKVHEAHDGEPEETPGKLSKNSEHPRGNFVVLELESKTYIVIAHLRNGSVLVKAGDQVEEGEPIGQCGNSGNTSEPHIHMHHQRQDPAKMPPGFAEGLPLFFRDHDGPPMPAGGVKLKDDGDGVIATGAVVRHVGAAKP